MTSSIATDSMSTQTLASSVLSCSTQKPSELSCPTWTAAFEVGVTKLYHLAKDERIGPRTAGEDKDAAPVG